MSATTTSGGLPTSAAPTTNATAAAPGSITLIQERAYCGVCEVTRVLVREINAVDIRCPICRSFVILGASGDD